VPGARKEFRGKETGAEAKCQEQGKNIGEKRRGSRSEVLGNKFAEKRQNQKRSAKSKERI
jgi:hypothetical protein